MTETRTLLPINPKPMIRQGYGYKGFGVWTDHVCIGYGFESIKESYEYLKNTQWEYAGWIGEIFKWQRDRL
jgi:hypothetical protein